jgi:hypothetical protein
MTIERTERRVTLAGERSDTDEIIEARRAMASEGWTFAYERPATDDSGDSIEDTVELSFWRSTDENEDSDPSTTSPEIVPERPSDWTRA